jgi:Bacteriodetes cell division protein (FtsL-like)
MNSTVNLNRPKRQAPPPVKGSTGRLIEQIRTLEFGDNARAKLVRYFMFVAACGLLYIANAHYADRSIREINTLQRKVEELRSGYTTLKAKSILEGKRAEIRQKVNALGLAESNEPAYELVMEED